MPDALFVGTGPPAGGGGAVAAWSARLDRLATSIAHVRAGLPSRSWRVTTATWRCWRYKGPAAYAENEQSILCPAQLIISVYDHHTLVYVSP